MSNMLRGPDGRHGVLVTEALVHAAQRVAENTAAKATLISPDGTVHMMFDSGDGQPGSVEDRRCDLCQRVQGHMLCGVGPVTFAHRSIPQTKAEVILGLCDRCLATQSGAN